MQTQQTALHLVSTCCPSSRVLHLVSTCCPDLDKMSSTLAGLDLARPDDLVGRDDAAGAAQQDVALQDTPRQDLSKDVLLILFKGLVIQELALVLQVSRSWRAAALDPLLKAWSSLTAETFRILCPALCQASAHADRALPSSLATRSAHTSGLIWGAPRYLLSPQIHVCVCVCTSRCLCLCLYMHAQTIK